MKTPEELTDEVITQIAKECDEVADFFAPALQEVIKTKTGLGVIMALTKLAAEVSFHEVGPDGAEAFISVAKGAYQKVLQVHGFEPSFKEGYSDV